ncbi:MAG: o-succinylbenzoate synthase [Candidatus Nanohaloarchaea archaeon]
MNFENLELRHVKLPLKNPFETSFGKIEDRNLVLLSGEVGGERFYGEASAQFAPLYNHEFTETDLEFIKQFAVPALRDSETVEEYREKVSGYRGSPMAKSAGEFLMLHARSVREGESLTEMIGGEPGEAVCGASIGLQDSPEDLVERVGELKDRGFHRAKIKIKPGKDLEYLREVRERFPDYPLMADANSAYTMDQLQRLKGLDRHDLQMVEQPLGSRDLYRHSKLAERIETPICLDESIRSAEDARKAAEMGAAEIINLKPQRVGGLIESREINRVARENGIDLWIGSLLESGIGASFLAASAGLSEVSYPNDLAPSSRYFEEDLVKPEIEMRDGRIEIPGEPGLKGDVVREKVRKHTRQKLEL